MSELLTTGLFSNASHSSATNSDSTESVGETQVLTFKIDPKLLDKMMDESANTLNTLFTNGQYAEAAKFAANAPLGVLRTPQTMQRFQQVPTQPGQTSPLLQYFGILLDQGQLNKYESFVLLNDFATQLKRLGVKWIKEDKLECSEELCDLVKSVELTLMTESDQKGQVFSVEEKNLIPYITMAYRMAARSNLTGADDPFVPKFNTLFTKFAPMLVADEEPLADINAIVDVLKESNLVQPEAYQTILSCGEEQQNLLTPSRMSIRMPIRALPSVSVVAEEMAGEPEVMRSDLCNLQ